MIRAHSLKPLPFTPNLIDLSLPSIERVVKAVKEVMYVVK